MSFRSACEHLLLDPRARAFLRVIRERESSQTDDAYRMRWGGLGNPPASFDDFSKHPRIFEPTTGGRVSSAAGAYQITATTWDEIAPEIDAESFAPHEQDLAAVRLLAKRRIMDHLLVDDFESAVAAARPTWTSLPGAEESSVSWTMAKARALYDHWVSEYSSMTQPAAPIEERGVPYQPPKEAPVPFPLLAILSMIAPMIPSLAKALNDGSVKGNKIEAIAPVVADVIVKATGAVNLQDAAEKVQANPEAAKAAEVALSDVFYSLAEVGGGVPAARQAALAFSQLNVSLWRMPAFILSMMLLVLVFFVVAMVMAARGTMTFIAAWMGMNADMVDRIAIGFNFSADMQNVVITAIVVGALSGVTGFWLGQSYGQQGGNRRATDANGGGK